jgi:hypothetical protein
MSRLHPRLNPRLARAEPLRRCRLEECRAACCLHGAWVDLIEVETILAHAARICPHMPPTQVAPDLWFDDRLEADEHALSGTVRHTTVLSAPDHYGGTACVFLRGDSKCALQVAAEASGSHPWQFKPFYCILHPLDLDAEGHITLDENEALLAEPASCLRPAHDPVPLEETFAPELHYLVGKNKAQEKDRF